MNPLSKTAQHQRVDTELRAIREAWPTARITRAGDRLTAVVIIDEPRSTCVVEVTPDSTRSLWVKHNSDGPDVTTGWVDGWVD